MTDEELIKAMASGDREVLAILYRRHGPWIAARLAGSTSSRDLAEEALQDTFIAAWRSATKYRGEGAVAAWLWGIARRRVVSLARRQHRALRPFGNLISIRRSSLRKRTMRRIEFVRRPGAFRPTSGGPSKPSSSTVARSGRRRRGGRCRGDDQEPPFSRTPAPPPRAER